MEKYPDLSADWKAIPWHSNASAPYTSGYFDKQLLGTKDRCSYYDPMTMTPQEKTPGDTNCVGVGINKDGLAVAIGDAWFVAMWNERIEQTMVSAAKKLDQQ